MKQRAAAMLTTFTLTITCSVTLLLITACPTSYAQSAQQPSSSQQPPSTNQQQPSIIISKEDAALLKSIDAILENTPESALSVSISDKGVISVSGVVKTSAIAAAVVGNITAIAKKRPIKFDKLLMVNGSPIAKEALVTGLVQGLLLGSGLYGKKVTTIKQMPVKVSVSDNIIFLDGGVNSLQILSQTIIIAQRFAITLSPPMRVISRMYIRGLIYGT